jgi:tetratricopeptide (TPR) repeat protein
MLNPWQEPPPAVRERDQALGEIVVGFKAGLPSVQESGIRLLDRLAASQLNSDPVALSALVAINLQRQRPQQALALARLAMERQPDSGRAALNLALALEQAGDLEGAERELLRATELDPSVELAWINLAKLYQKQGRRAGMLALIDRYLEWNPQSITFRRRKAMLSPK